MGKLKLSLKPQMMKYSMTCSIAMCIQTIKHVEHTNVLARFSLQLQSTPLNRVTLVPEHFDPINLIFYFIFIFLFFFYQHHFG